MHSKHLPWDFIRQHPTLIEDGKYGIYAFSCFDPYMQKLFLSCLPIKTTALVGEEITHSWLESHLETLDMFSATGAGAENYLVLEADRIPKDGGERLLELDIDNRYLILCFLQRGELASSLSEREDIFSLEVTPPSFWESDKLLSFLSARLGIKLPQDIFDFILASTPATCGDFIAALKNIALLAKEGDLSLSSVQELIVASKMDQFALARSFSNKNYHEFYGKLLDLSVSPEVYRGFFSFMQGHLLKIADPSYAEKKKRLSGYDKEIVQYSRRWQRGEIKDALHSFSKLEIAAKSGATKELLRKKLLENCEV